MGRPKRPPLTRWAPFAPDWSCLSVAARSRTSPGHQELLQLLNRARAQRLRPALHPLPPGRDRAAVQAGERENVPGRARS